MQSIPEFLDIAKFADREKCGQQNSRSVSCD